ncbi:tetratricopeptide repeat-containing sensor histidine kinase [Flavobacterium faecale]|uniref:ATP-binding protein n=1 Tax=Flavobacterium faecale TaxID=1355330 RepID=UPI001FECF8F7|nr:tetratricopeptide repeat-containing sensor histidine kinase [Flavobacterium faecale]
MLIKIRLYLGVLLFLICLSSTAQQKQIDSLLGRELLQKIKVFKKETNLSRAAHFFVEKKWDSTLVHAMKQLSMANNNKLVVDYCHFFRAYSFYQKKLMNASEKEFSQVSKSFGYYYLVKIYLGNIALGKEKYKEAISYYQNIENTEKEKNYIYNKSGLKHNIGISYLHLEKFDDAEKYLLQSIDLQKLNSDPMMLSGSYGDLGTLYYVQFKDAMAIPYFVKAYELSKKTSDFDLKRKTALNMAVVEKNRNKFDKALAYREESDRWKDSLNDQNKIWEVAKLEKQFAVKQKQKEVRVLQAENKIKVAERNGFLYSALFLLLLLGAGIYLYREKIKTNKIILAQKENLDELNATKDKLFSVVSHDLRSSVNAMKRSNAKLIKKVATKDLEEIDQLLHQNSGIANSTYNLLDNLLNWAILQTGQSFFEITSLRLFFMVEQVAYNYIPLMEEKNMLFENNIAKKDLVLFDQESLKLILRNLLDNAIKFSNDSGTIKVYTRTDDSDFCTLVVEDNGLGMTAETRSNLVKSSSLLSKKENENIIGTGLGMQLCKSLVAKNNAIFDVESEIGIGTKIIIKIARDKENV